MEHFIKIIFNHLLFDNTLNLNFNSCYVCICDYYIAIVVEYTTQICFALKRRTSVGAKHVKDEVTNKRPYRVCQLRGKLNRYKFRSCERFLAAGPV